MRTLLFITALILCAPIFSQNNSNPKRYQEMMYDPSYNFYEVVDAAEAYFSTIDRNEKGSGWKPFERWRVQNEYKYYPDGVRSNVDPQFAEKQFQNFIKNNPTNKSLFNGRWRELGPNTIDSITGHYSAGLGRVEDLYVSPQDSNLLYLGSRSGGFWRSIDGGANWTVTTDSLFAGGVNTFTVSPTNSDSILINVRNSRNGTSHGIYRSTNGGISWTATNFNPTQVGFGGLGTSFQILDIAYHPRVPSLVFIATNEGLFKSSNNLSSWSRALNQDDINQIAFHPTNDSILYVYNTAGTATANQIYRSTNQGNTYSLTNSVQGNNFNKSVVIATSPVCPSCVYFASDNGVWLSKDEGQNFQFLSNPTESCDAFSVSDLDTSIMIYGYVDLENSTDGGKNFTRTTRWSLGNTNGAGNGNAASYQNSTNYIHADLRNSICVNGVFYVATDGFIAKSNDHGVNWTILSEGTGIRENYSLGTSQSNHYRTICGSQDNGTSIYTEKGWVEFYGADGMEGIIHPLNDDWMIGSVQYGSRRLTQNGGFSQKSATPTNSANADWVAPLAYDPNNPMRIYDFRNRVYKSNDFSENWSTLGLPTFSGDIQKAAIAENNSNIIVVARGGSLAKSSNGGLNFFNIRNILPNYSIQDIAFDPQDDNTMVVVYGRHNNDGQKVYITHNGGGSWTNITYNLGSMPIRSVVIDHTASKNIYVGAEIGVFVMPMNSTNWNLYNPGLPNTSILEMEINYGSNTLRAATWGRGLWEYALLARSNYPAITNTTITDPPTLGTPKFSVAQFVNSKIHYNGSISSVYLEWSKDTISLGNRINMTNIGGNEWQSAQALPQFPIGSRIFFKVFAVGSNSDTSETYRFNYEIKPYDYCAASGNTSSGNLYISRVSLGGLNSFSGNNNYSLTSSPLFNLYADSTYQIQLNANTSWTSNDFGAWIDFNNNRSFDPSEEILFARNAGSFGISSFHVPPNVTIGDTVRLRARVSYFTDPAPCGDEFGEVEDHLIVWNSLTTEIESFVSNQLAGAKLIPNPTKGDFSIVLPEQVKNLDILVRTSTGQLVYRGKIDSGRNLTIQKKFSPGMYYIHLSTTKERSTLPLVILE